LIARVRWKKCPKNKEIIEIMGTGYDAEWSIIIEGIEFERINFFGILEEILNNCIFLFI